MVDETLVLRKLAELEEYYRQIQDYKDTTVEAYASDWKTQRIVERTLQMMIETSVDVAGHIISDQKYRVPASYADTFKVLYEEKIIDDALFSTMEKMAKFRNVVVHHYDKVDAEIVVVILKKHLGDFTSFQNAIIQFLKNG